MTTFRSLAIIAGAFCALAFSHNAADAAATTVVTSLNAWQTGVGVTGTETVTPFNSAGLTSAITGTLTSFWLSTGHKINVASSSAVASPGGWGGNTGTDLQRASPITLTNSGSSIITDYGLGFWLYDANGEDTITLSATGTGVTLSQTTINLSGNAIFIGLYATTPGAMQLASLTLTSSNASTLTVGDFYEAAVPAVPEPASMALLGVGLVGLGAYRRRRRA